MSSHSPNELRFTETNSADDSSGKTWGLEGDLFWYVAGGAFASVLTLLLLFSVWHWSFVSALFPSALPLGFTLLYVFLLRQGKPPGHDADQVELWLKGSGFGPEPSSSDSSFHSSSSHHV